jgi:hypothetical protein
VPADAAAIFAATFFFVYFRSFPFPLFLPCAIPSMLNMDFFFFIAFTPVAALHAFRPTNSFA